MSADELSIYDQDNRWIAGGRLVDGLTRDEALRRVAALAATLPADPPTYHERRNLPSRCGKPARYRFGTAGDIRPLPHGAQIPLGDAQIGEVFATDMRDRHLFNRREQPAKCKEPTRSEDCDAMGKWVERRWWGEDGRFAVDYDCRVDGPLHWSIVLRVKGWRDLSGYYTSACLYAYDQHVCDIWRGDVRRGHPHPDAAKEAAEAWLSEWIAGWTPGMRCADADIAVDTGTCAESLSGWIGPFCGCLDRRDSGLSAHVIHAPHGALWTDCASGVWGGE